MIAPLLRCWNRLEVSQVRTRRLPALLIPYVPAGGTVLDVGSGDGYIASRLLHEAGAAGVCGVDVLPQPKPHIPVTVFDGHHLPYEDDTFDLVTLIDVLHHTMHCSRLLAEAARVSKGPVLVKDHYWVTRLDRWILALADYLGNKPNGVALPYNFLRMEQWSALFEELSLTAVSTERFHYAPYDRSKQVVFLLAPTEGTGESGGTSTSMA
ncbi:class I SAM-dependent methyltransferase [Caenispirillum bisanense]|uniref:Ubiquinone/menaquinone biosynthesis C-methylase UbiE n=1 Tax=Caenispirillum bisanense TaxID=414052 RepID=A0A286GWQ3_9PROT|nr:class I SAM-dependent methyltransferase [Caenispirillum bisanense]SOD99931.1 Ubiquinone/menaquinone biosynthesis C-methylase UbiE [Caenispirillum bisanense]